MQDSRKRKREEGNNPSPDRAGPNPPIVLRSLIEGGGLLKKLRKIDVLSLALGMFPFLLLNSLYKALYPHFAVSQLILSFTIVSKAVNQASYNYICEFSFTGKGTWPASPQSPTIHTAFATAHYTAANKY